MNNKTKWTFLTGFSIILLANVLLPCLVAQYYDWEIWDFSENYVASMVWGISTPIVTMLLLVVFWIVWPAMRVPEQTWNDEFYARQAKNVLAKLETKVLNSVALSASDRTKFLAEVATLVSILSERIPHEMRRTHTIMLAHSDDEDRDLLSIHKCVASYTNFYFSVSLRIREMVAKPTLAGDDIDDELSTMIDEWEKIEKRDM